MSDHPSTFEGTPEKSGAHAWEDRAALQAKATSRGVLSGANSIQRGTFAEMIRAIIAMPEEKRDDFVIEKLGDREYTADEAAALASSPDFPKQ